MKLKGLRQKFLKNQYNKNWEPKGRFDIDERGYNIIDVKGGINIKTKLWIESEFLKMKLSNPLYGTYSIDCPGQGREGRKNLLANDFFLWLRDNQIK